MATNTALQDIFAFRNISEAIDAVKNGIPERFPKEFSSITENVVGNETTFHKFYGQRKGVRRIEYAGPAPMYNQQKVGQVGLVLSSFGGKVQIEQELVLRLRQTNDLMAQDRAKDFLARANKDHLQRFLNNRILHWTQLLSHGIYWYDAEGDLNQSSSGAIATVDMGIPSGNKTDIGGIIGAPWSTDTTDIFLHVEKIKRAAVRATGRPLKHAFYGLNIPGYIYKNATMKHYFQHNQQFYAAFANNPSVIPDGFLELTWHKMSDAFYEDQDGTVTNIFPEDQVTFTPAIDRDVYTMFEGSVTVPTKIGIGNDLNDALDHSEVKYGMYGFSNIRVESALVADLVYGDNFCPMWKSPLDMYLADTTP